MLLWALTSHLVPTGHYDIFTTISVDIMYAVASGTLTPLVSQHFKQFYFITLLAFFLLVFAKVILEHG